jgi:methylmalonyl-CoA mutase cobalamin-binding domain/chain
MDLNDELATAILEGKSERSVSLAMEIVQQKKDLNDAIINGLHKGMHLVGERYDNRQYFLPEIIVAADALYDALAVFKPHLQQRDQEPKATVVIGVVRGDIHDIGKNVTRIFLETAGYKVVDCGRNVPAEQFIDAVKEHRAQVLALSTLMSPTLDSITQVVELLKQRGLRDGILVIIGGAATSEEFARKIGVDCIKEGYAAVTFLDGRFAKRKGAH